VPVAGALEARPPDREADPGGADAGRVPPGTRCVPLPGQDTGRARRRRAGGPPSRPGTTCRRCGRWRVPPGTRRVPLPGP